MRQLEDKFEEAMTLRSDYLHRFKMLYTISSKLCRFCFEVDQHFGFYYIHLL
jgi:dynactin 1